MIRRCDSLTGLTLLKRGLPEHGRRRASDDGTVHCRLILLHVSTERNFTAFAGCSQLLHGLLETGQLGRANSTRQHGTTRHNTAQHIHHCGGQTHTVQAARSCYIYHDRSWNSERHFTHLPTRHRRDLHHASATTGGNPTSSTTTTHDTVPTPWSVLIPLLT